MFLRGRLAKSPANLYVGDNSVGGEDRPRTTAPDPRHLSQVATEPGAPTAMWRLPDLVRRDRVVGAAWLRGSDATPDPAGSIPAASNPILRKSDWT